MPDADPKEFIIPCKHAEGRAELIEKYADELAKAAPSIGSHGLSNTDFVESRIFQAAVEKLRGRTAASMAEKHAFLHEVLGFMAANKKIQSFTYTGAGDRHDYQITMPDGKLVVFEAKGCLDGNNTNIFTRPANADEFFIWSLCQNPGADPRHNAWSGIHTRLGATILADKARVNGLVIWDMLCGTAARPCPKKDVRFTTLPSGKKVPPPCIYLFPRSIPDPRNNENPSVWTLSEVSFFKALYDTFQCSNSDVIEVRLHTRMDGANVQRKTILSRDGTKLAESGWTTLKRAVR